LLISPELLVLVKVRWLELILFDEDEDGPAAVEGPADDALFQKLFEGPPLVDGCGEKCGTLTTEYCKGRLFPLDGDSEV
jgi:hypothetical protein